MADRPDLPSPSAPNFDQRIRETLMVYLGRQGNPLDRGLTMRDLVEAGVIEVRPGFTLNNSGAQPPIRPGPAVIGDPTPDFTPPPTPTGFAVIASLTNIFVEHDNPTFTQGRGHLRTRVFGAKYVSGPLPTIANAVEIGQFTGTVFVFPSDVGTTWRLWIRWETRDGVIGQPAGGTNGLEATTGKIGNADLGPLIVEAGNIANNAVVTTKLADAAVTAAKLIDNAITAQKIVDGAVITAKLADAGITSAKIVDGGVVTAKLADSAVTSAKLIDNAVTAQKIVAGAVTETKISDSAISTPKLAANAVTAGKIAANAVTADAVAANAITTSKLLVIPESLCPDPYFEDVAWWTTNTYSSPGWYFENWAAGNTPDVMGVRRSATLWSGGGSNGGAFTGTGPVYVWSGEIPYSAAGQVLRVRARCRNASNQAANVIVRFRNATGVVLQDSELSFAAGSGVTTGTTQVTVPANTARISFIIANGGGPAFSGLIGLSEIKVDAAASADVIVDGAVIANKIATNAITTDKIAANAVAAGKIAANAVTANELAANSVVAGKIATNAVTADAVAASAITTAKLLVVDQGLCLNADPNTRDLSAWVYSGSMAVVNDTTSPTGGTVIEAVNNGQLLSRSAAIDPTRNYEVRIWIKQQAGSSAAYLTVAFQDAAGTHIVAASAAAGGSWPAAGWFFYFGLLNQTASGTWTEYRISFGPNETAQIPSGARFCNVGFLANYATIGTQRVTGIRLMQKADAELIVDGAITANKVAANAIVAGKIAANAIGAAQIIAGSITGDRLAAATITAGNIQAGSITGDRLQANTITGDRLAANTITAGNIAAGAISADKISSGTGGKNLLQNSGPNLESPTIQWLKTWDGNAGAGTRIVGASPSDWRPPGVGGLYVQGAWWAPANGSIFADITNTHHNNGVFAGADAVPCIPGRRYEFHAWLSAHRCAAEPRVFFFNSAGAYLSESPGSGGMNLAGNINDQSNQGKTGTSRYGGFVTAPAGAVTMAFYIRCYGRGLADPYAFISQAYLGEATANQTEASPWSAGAASTTIIGDNIKSGTIQANRLSVSELSAITSTVGLLRTAASGARVEIADNVIKVFDTSGVLRVKIGNLAL